ncbi:MAG: VOC family protein [Vicinamibacterales bacterium]
MGWLARGIVLVFAAVGVVSSVERLVGQAGNPMQPVVTHHLGIIVRDVDEAAKTWSRVFGVTVPPPKASGYTEWTGAHTPGRWRVKLTSFQLGQMTIELVEPLDAAGPHRAHLDRFGQGLHHIGFVVADRPAGFAHLTRQGGTQTSPTYVDMKDLLGTTVELVPTVMAQAR